MICILVTELLQGCGWPWHPSHSVKCFTYSIISYSLCKSSYIQLFCPSKSIRTKSLSTKNNSSMIYKVFVFGFGPCRYLHLALPLLHTPQSFQIPTNSCYQRGDYLRRKKTEILSSVNQPMSMSNNNCLQFQRSKLSLVSAK